MKATEKKVLENLLKKIDEELQRATKEVDIASDKVVESDYNKNIYNYYQQRYEYMNGIQMGKTIVISQLRKLGIEVK